MINVLLTGAKGQFGKCVEDAAPNYPELNITYVDKEELDITKLEAFNEYFKNHNFDYCINAAAYTNVEKAESDAEMAFLVNAKGVGNLAETCKKHDCTLIHLSTDYVFNGLSDAPYVETDKTNPINVYGTSKLKGEVLVEKSECNYFIIRTSWLYSLYGNNFLKTIIRLVKEQKDLRITSEQLGTPTNANDLARAILEIINSKSGDYGLYHYSNEGEATWFDFAQEIINNHPELNSASLVKSNDYRTFAERPKYSVLDKSKFYSTFKIKPINWKDSLKSLIITAN